ncbi:MAG: substrate-binding domain-containing protein, partial [Alphaproteobacteria bacterium]
RRLARGTVETVGYVLPPHASNRTDPFLSEMLEGISQALAARDWDLVVASPDNPDDELGTYERLVTSGKVSGLILARTLSEDPRISYLLSNDVPFVSHGRTRDPSDYAWLDVDNEKAARDAVAHLAGLGHRQIAMIAAPVFYNFSRLRVEGYRSGMTAHGLPLRDDYLIESDMSAQGGREAVGTLLAIAGPPTAVICVTDLIAIGAMQGARLGGRQVGEDLSVIGYDGLPFGAYTDPPLTTMTQDVIKTGRRATEILLEILDGASPTQFQEISHARLIRRASDGPPP